MATMSQSVSGALRSTLSNARWFILGLSLLIVIAALNLTFTALTVNHLVEEQMKKQQLISLWKDNNLLLKDYLLNGDLRNPQKLSDNRRLFHDLLQSDGSQRKLADLEENWYSQFAKPLIDKRKSVDAGFTTVAELEIAFLQSDGREWEPRFAASIAMNPDESENFKNAVSALLKWRIVTAVALGLAGLIVAMLALRSTAKLANMTAESR